MITVINEETAVNTNPYPGMTLAEACGAMEMAVMEAVNDFQMGVLLTEHAHLYANGTEMSYVDEAGNFNEKAAALKEKAVGVIKFCGEKIAELWDKAIEWATRFMSSTAAALNKASISKKMAYRVAENFGNLVGSSVEVLGVGHTVDQKFLDAAYKAYIKANAAGEEDPKAFYEKFVHKNEGGIMIDAATFKAALDSIFSNPLLADIKKAKKDANDTIKEHIAQVKSMKPDDMDEKIAGLKKTMNSNTRITREAVRVYNVYANSQAQIVRSIMNQKEVKAFVRGEAVNDIKAAGERAKESAKAAPGKAAAGAKAAGSAVADAAKAAPGKVVAGAKSAGEKISGGAKDAVDSIKGAGEKVRKHFTRK